MVRIKKAMRLFVLICLIVLASIGVGLSGGVPIPMSNSRKDTEKENIELIENQEEESNDELT